MSTPQEAPLRVLYAAFRHDPDDPDRASGADFQFARALREQGFELRVSGPVQGPAWPVERLFRRFYRRASGRDYSKFPLSLALRSTRQLTRDADAMKPDVIFTLFPPPLALYTGAAPCIYRLDTCFLGWQEQYPQFGSLALTLLLWQERRALRRSRLVITHSQWTRDLLLSRYGLDAQKVRVFPNPAALALGEVPRAIDTRRDKLLEPPFRLLLVGREARRKGVDVALEVAAELSHRGIAVELTICGPTEPPRELPPGARFVGPYRKSVAAERARYLELYRRAHLMLHPARFDPSPIAVSEAAAFGVPTITNASGGLATSVKDGETGIVLPRSSPPEAYAEAICSLVADSERYYTMCTAARRRFEQELNWRVAGERLGELVREATVHDTARAEPDARKGHG